MCIIWFNWMQPTNLEKCQATGLYVLASFGTTLTNKYILTTRGFPSPIFLAIAQFATGIIWGKVRGHRIVFLEFSEHKSLFLLPIFFLFNTVFGISSTGALSLPMFTVLRRFGLIITMCLEALLLNKVSSADVQFCVALMVLGAAIAAADDLSFDLYSYVVIFANNFSTAVIAVLNKRLLSGPAALDQCSLLALNSLLAFPFLSVFLLVFRPDECVAIWQYPQWRDPSFSAAFIASCLLSMALNFASAMSTQRTSALTTAIVGSVKNIATTYAGMWMFGDYTYSGINFVGINVSLLGALLYAYCSFKF
jgi:solute carrier family 35 protein